MKVFNCFNHHQHYTPIHRWINKSKIRSQSKNTNFQVDFIRSEMIVEWCSTNVTRRSPCFFAVKFEKSIELEAFEFAIMKGGHCPSAEMTRVANYLCNLFLESIMVAQQFERIGCARRFSFQYYSMTKVKLRNVIGNWKTFENAMKLKTSILKLSILIQCHSSPSRKQHWLLGLRYQELPKQGSPWLLQSL